LKPFSSPDLSNEKWNSSFRPARWSARNPRFLQIN